MEYLPLFINLKNRSVLVIGGGSIAARKVQMLDKTGAKIKIVSDKLCPKLNSIILMKKNINWIGKKFSSSMLEKVFLVISATNDQKICDLVYEIAEKNYVLINTVDNQNKCSFIFPSIIDRSPIMIGISSGGRSPVLVRILREKLESLLPSSIGSIAEFAGRWRKKVKEKIFNVVYRRRFWEKIFFNNRINKLINQGSISEADHVFKDILTKKDFQNKKGQVALVGAGPGDVGLLTLRGLQEIQQADVVLYDSLVNPNLLELIRRDADIICVGKKSGSCSMSQECINQLIVKFANKGSRVVRLKGGDSFIFGRGAEELQVISKYNIPFYVVPGITAGIGVTAYAGIPLTHRKYSQSVIFLTGHTSDNVQLNWKLYSEKNMTIVVYMMKNNAFEIKKKLIFYGKDVNTPIALISRGTYFDQQVLIGTLKELEKLVQISLSPTLLVIGEIVNFHHKISWFNKNTWDLNKFNSILRLKV